MKSAPECYYNSTTSRSHFKLQIYSRARTDTQTFVQMRTLPHTHTGFLVFIDYGIIILLQMKGGVANLDSIIEIPPGQHIVIQALKTTHTHRHPRVPSSHPTPRSSPHAPPQ
jgi:hypothetical protein